MKINKTIFPLACLFFLAQISTGQVKNQIQKITLQPGEKVWAGVINDGQKMPFASDYAFDFYGNNNSNIW